MLEAGEYRARAVKAALGLAKSGSEQVGVQFELLDVSGQSITWYGSFANDQAFEITMKGMRAAGFRGDDLADLSSLEDGNTPEVTLVVVHETYQGKTQVKVKFINAGGGLAMKTQLEGDQAKAFAARMKGRVLAFNQGAGPAPSAGGAAKPAAQQRPAPRAQPQRPAPTRAAAPPRQDEPPLDLLEGQDPTNEEPEPITF
jgi:hypothetical protein